MEHTIHKKGVMKLINQLLTFVEWGEYLQTQVEKNWTCKSEVKRKINEKELKEYFHIQDQEDTIVLIPKGLYKGEITICLKGEKPIIDTKEYWLSLSNEYQEYKDYQNQLYG